MQTWSDSYGEQQRQMHADPERPYGVMGERYGQAVRDIWIKATDGKGRVLDYGCGRGTLGQSIPVVPVTNYDPFVDKFAARPEGKFEVVACTDVLEHVEREHVPDVLADVFGYSTRAVFLQVALGPAKKTLPDGRNAHITILPLSEWVALIENTKGIIRNIVRDDHGFICICEIPGD